MGLSKAQLTYIQSVSHTHPPPDVEVSVSTGVGSSGIAEGNNIILKSFQKFHIFFSRDEFCSKKLLKSVCASQDISQGVSHPNKIHIVFTWTSYTLFTGFLPVVMVSDLSR